MGNLFRRRSLCEFLYASTLLKAAALAALGPAGTDSGIYANKLIPREPDGSARARPQKAVIEAVLTPQEQDSAPPGLERIGSHMTITRLGDLESLRWTHGDEKPYQPIIHTSYPPRG